jgi:hypothetical protein
MARKLTLEEAAVEAECSYKTILRAIYGEDLSAHRPAFGRLTINEADLRAWIDRRIQRRGSRRIIDERIHATAVTG